MLNNNILNKRGVAVALILLWACVANGEDELEVALGVQLGAHGFTNVSHLCKANVRCTYKLAAPTLAPYLRLELSPQHSVIAAYRLGFNQKMEETNSTPITTSQVTTFFTTTTPAGFTVRTTSLAYEFRPPLGIPDWEAFLKIGYHNSKLSAARAEDSGSFGGILLGGGVVQNELLIAGYEYFDAGDLEHGHYLYLGVEFGL